MATIPKVKIIYDDKTFSAGFLFSLTVVVGLLITCIFLFKATVDSRIEVATLKAQIEVAGLAPEPYHYPPKMPDRGYRGNR